MDSAEKGQLGAHTLAENSADAAIRSVLGEVQADPMLPGLVEDVPDDFDVLGRMAEQINAKRRGAGRPVNSANKRNPEMFEYMEALGFKMPERRKMEIISADPIELAQAIMDGSSQHGCKPSPGLILQVIAMQDRSANDLMPYKFAKRQELQVNHNGAVAHVMMAGRLVAPGEGLVKEWSLTGEATEISNENNDGQSSVS